MRIEQHPIIEDYRKGPAVRFLYNGQEANGFAGESIAAALRAMGVRIHRYTTKQHKPRGVFCAIGRCTDCVMVVNGVPNVRTCITPLEEGMTVQTQYGLKAGEGK
jgi:predicted molibdopterin-dependent oxidoreductase YjgC